jgi:hypothetical protein
MKEPSDHDNRLHALLRLRLLVAYLGERPQYNWWSSMFLGSTGASVLAHPFPRTAHLAQYHGAVEAARKTHDDLIGIGQVLHPFRAPDEVEQDLHALVLQGGATAFSSMAPGRDSVLSQLTAMGAAPTEPMVGPALVGEPGELLTPEAMRKVAGIYAAAFTSGQRAYPYFKAL